MADFLLNNPKLQSSLDANTNSIVNVVDPTLDQDAATKKYADDAIVTLTTNYLDDHPHQDVTNGAAPILDATNMTNIPTTSPAGADNQIQFNNGGAFGASANLTWDDAILRVQQIEITDRGVDRNTFIGDHAGRDLTTGINNVGIGDEAMVNIESGSYNTAIGSALTQLTSGGGNFGLGHQALRAVTSGNHNVGVGGGALYNIASGHSGNVGIGANGGRGAYGYFNVAIGNDAMYGTSSGGNNVAVGHQSLRTGGAKNDNVAIGTQAGYTLGAGDGNVFVGNEAAKLITSGSDNVFIGNFAGAAKTGSVSDTLWIDSTNTATPLIYGEFNNDLIKINGDVIVEQALCTTALSPAEITGNTNNWAVNTNSFVRYTADGAYNLTGIVAGVDGQRMTLINVSATTMTLKHEDASSTDVNRFLMTTGADVAMTENTMVDMIYDATTGRWRVTDLL